MPKASQKYSPLCILLLAALSLLMGIAAPQESLHKNDASDDEFFPNPVESTNADAHYFEISNQDLMAVLNDPKDRVSDTFQVPKEIQPMVGFWLQIYAKYSLYQTLIYDREHPDMIYDVVDSKDLFKRGLSPIALEITAKNKLQKTLAAYRAALHQLQLNPKKHFATGTAGATLISKWGRISAQRWRQANTNLRTQPGQRDRIMQGIATADPFIPAMESIFKKYDLPTELTRIPLVESSFNTGAVSKAAAVGVWQFLERSAMEYIVVDEKNKIDERLSPIKSTYAAALMFKRNYHILKDYGLAVIAYNHGARNLVKISHKYQGKDIAKLLKMTTNSPLGFASRNYYAEFLALLHAEKYRDKLYNMTLPSHPPTISIVKMKKAVSIFDIATIYRISLHELRFFNPDIFDLKRRLPVGTKVVIPRKVDGSIVQNKEAVLESDGPSRGIASELELIEDINQ